MANFAEKVKLQTSNLVMQYFGKADNGQDFFAYIYCTEAGVKKMHNDYENNISTSPSSYGEVIYSDNLSEPDKKAQLFLRNWLAQNGGEAL